MRAYPTGARPHCASPQHRSQLLLHGWISVAERLLNLRRPQPMRTIASPRGLLHCRLEPEVQTQLQATSRVGGAQVGSAEFVQNPAAGYAIERAERAVIRPIEDVDRLDDESDVTLARQRDVLLEPQVDLAEIRGILRVPVGHGTARSPFIQFVDFIERHAGTPLHQRTQTEVPRQTDDTARRDPVFLERRIDERPGGGIVEKIERKEVPALPLTVRERVREREAP